MTIPKTIFQTWKSKTEFPPKWAYWSQTLRDVNPDYDYVLWDDADNRAFIAEYWPWFLERYDSFPAEIYRADAVRFFYLFRNGGYYFDMDVEGLRPLDDLPVKSGVLLGGMGVNPTFDHAIPNAVMASSPGEEFWLLAIALMTEVPISRPEFTTGPVILKAAYDLYTTRYNDPEVQARLAVMHERMGDSPKSRVSLMPGHVFFPLDWNDIFHDTFRRELRDNDQLLNREDALKVFPHSTTVTYWSHSWEPEQK